MNGKENGMPQKASAPAAMFPGLPSAEDISLGDLATFGTYLDAFLPGWRWPEHPASRQLQAGIVVMTAGAVARSAFHDLPPDLTLAARLRELSADHRSDVADRDRDAAAARAAQVAAQPIVLREPVSVTAVTMPRGPENFDPAKKLTQYGAILDREPWIGTAPKISRQALFTGASHAEIFLATLKRTATASHRRNAGDWVAQCETALFEQGFRSPQITLAALVLAAMALEIVVEHQRELRPWLIFLGVE